MKVNKEPRLWASLIAVVLASAGRAQTRDTFEEIAARVTTTVPGTGILIDRGKDDGVEVGDRLQFSERGGQAYFGVAIELEGRSAVVRPEDLQFRPGPGVRAVVYVSDARLAAPAPAPVKVPVPAPTSDPNTPADRPRPTWSNPDDEWNIDMPLLAGVRAVPPSERPRRISGRSYVSFDRIVDTEADRGDVFLRGGGGVFAENPFGRGGVLHFDGEWNLRKAEIPDDNDESDGTSDPNVNKLEPLDVDDIDDPERPHVRSHVIRSIAKTTASGHEIQGIDDHTCAGCHQGSNRTVMQYWGIRLDQNQDVRRGRQYPANRVSYQNTSNDPKLFDPAVGNNTFNGRNRNQYLAFEDYDGDGRDDTPPDVHHEAGMGCIDCHGSHDLHGGDVR